MFKGVPAVVSRSSFKEDLDGKTEALRIALEPSTRRRQRVSEAVRIGSARGKWLDRVMFTGRPEHSPERSTTPTHERETMQKTNKHLETDVQDELEWDPVFDSSRVNVKANDGNVTLTGAVDSYYDTILASDDAWSVSGVKSLDNELMIGLVGDAIGDADIASSCREALDRDRFVPKGAVSVTVVEGWVTLSGEVHRHFQRKAAHDAVSRIDGVLGITNKVALTSDPIPGNVADRINKAFLRDAIIDDSLIDVSAAGNTVYLDGTVGSWYAMDDAVDTAWEAPGVTEVVNRLVIAP